MNSLSLAIVLTLAVACKAKPEPAPKAQPTPVPVTSATASTKPAAAPPAGFSEADVRGFVSRWETAQNERDFAAYSALYAERFTGVKRVGTYSKRFDRAGWLADRKPMFAAGAQVRVTELAQVAGGGATRAVFTQEFTSAGFKDVGKKELFLVPVAGGIAISREEMLSSQVSGEPAGDTGVLAFHRDGVVVQRGYEKSRLQGSPRLLSAPNASPIDIGFSVAPEELAGGARAWLGKDVTAYTTTGESCSGKVTRFEVRVRAVPHFGMRQAWNGELGEPKAAPLAVAHAIENMAQDDEHFVVGVLEPSCIGSWATGAPQVFVRAQPAPAALRDVALAAFRALPAYTAMQSKFVKESGDASRGWETVNGELSVTELRATGRPALLVVAARSGGGCAGFNGSLSAVWNVAGSDAAPTLQAITPVINEHVTLRGALDSGPAHDLALLAGPDNYDDQLAVLRLAPRATRRVVFATSFWDCDC